MNEKRILGEIFALKVADGRATQKALCARLGEDAGQVEKAVSALRARRLVEGSPRGLRLTDKGRAKVKVVFIGGSFELIHPGHLHTILQAKNLGDVLVAVVARDTTIRRRKHREPITTENERLNLLSSLRAVDAAMLGVEGDIYVTLEKVKPDVVALGYDQYHAEEEIAKEAARRGMRLRVFRLRPATTIIKTSKIIEALS
ncbi:MAG: FAD synthase [Nitrososphaerales archaeon]|nr:FAD synthase [Nitrososphaerales archaeon]